MKIACVLRSGGDYGPEHVAVLRRMLAPHEVIAIVDAVVARSVPEPRLVMAHDWPGWWSKLELMDTERLPGDLLYFDLDTVICGSLDAVFAACRGDRAVLLEDFYRRCGLQSAMMYLPEAKRAQAWAVFAADPVGIMQRFSHRSDQEFLETLWASEAVFWQDILPDDCVVSYKVHCQRGLPAGASVVIFHGRPRPWETDLWPDEEAA